MDGCLSLFITFFSANVTDLHLKELSFVTESQSLFLRFKCIFSQLTSARWKRCQNPSWNPIVHIKAHLFCYQFSVWFFRFPYHMAFLKFLFICRHIGNNSRNFFIATDYDAGENAGDISLLMKCMNCIHYFILKD